MARKRNYGPLEQQHLQAIDTGLTEAIKALELCNKGTGCGIDTNARREALQQQIDDFTAMKSEFFSDAR